MLLVNILNVLIVSLMNNILFFLTADKNDTDESDEENELLTKDATTTFNIPGTDDKADKQNINKNQKANIVK